MLTRVIKFSDNKGISGPLVIDDNLLKTKEKQFIVFENITRAECEELKNKIGINDLVIEDILESKERGKIDDYGDWQFLALEYLGIDGNDEIRRLQISVLYFDRFIICIKDSEVKLDKFIKKMQTGDIRSESMEHVLIGLVDYLGDSCYDIFEKIREKLDDLEERTYQDPDKQDQEELKKMREALLNIRKVGRNFSAVIRLILKDAGNKALPFDVGNTRFWSDVLDTFLQLLELLEIERDLLNVINQNIVNAISNKSNQIVQVLTILTAFISIPTFLASVGGMNTEPIPVGTSWWVWMGLMLLSTLGVYIYFKKKKWI